VLLICWAFRVMSSTNCAHVGSSRQCACLDMRQENKVVRGYMTGAEASRTTCLTFSARERPTDS
jgi:hypothetical protein